MISRKDRTVRKDTATVVLCSGIFILLAGLNPMSALASLGLAAIVALFIWRSDYGLTASVALYPVLPPYLGVEFGGVVLFWQRLVVYTLVVMAAVSMAFIFRTRWSVLARISLRSPRLGLALWLLFGLSLLRVLSEVQSGGLRGLVATGNELLAFVFLAACGAVLWRDAEHRTAVLRGLVIAAAYTAAFAAFEFVVGANPLAEFAPVRADMVSASEQLTRFGRIRATATLGQPIAVGQIVLLGVGALHALPSSALISPLRWPTQLLFFVGIVATGTRSTFVALILAIILVALRSVRSLLFAALGVAVFLFQPFVFREALDGLGQSIVLAVSPASSSPQQISPDDQASRISALSRVAQVVVSIPVLAESPLLGVGMLNVKERTGLRTIDNYYLLSALEAGIPAALLFVLLCAVSLSCARRVQGSARESDGLYFAIASSLVMLLFVALKVAMPLVFLVVGIAIGTLEDSEGLANG